MPLLFKKSLELKKGLWKDFNVYRIAPNLYEAFAEGTIAILWREDGNWIGETNDSDKMLIDKIGRSIDAYTQEYVEQPGTS